MALYFTFKDATLPTVEQVGGKGLSLILLTHKGFPVPPGVVLSTRFFEPWLEQLQATPEWHAFIHATDEERPAATAAIKKRCCSLAFTGEQQQTLAEVRQHLWEEGITLMAVRSSAPEEDLEKASFAGIYETVLGVTEAGLEDAIKTCFASAFDERVVAYKLENGFDPFQPRIAVVIQKQIAAEVAGVAFSLNPVSNCYDECVINANFGLGETVVSGIITPDQAVVDKVTHTILEKKPGQKDIALYLKPSGGIERRPPASPSAFCLTDAQILAIAALTTRVEAELGKPTDIEWAYEADQLYLLQARPITTYYRLPEQMITPPGAQKNLYHDALLTEQGFPENMSPLGEAVLVRGTAKMMEALGADASITTFERGVFFGCAGRVYTHIGRSIKLAGKKRMLSTIRHVDSRGAEILEAIDLQEYIPKKLPKGLRLTFLKMALGGIRIFWPAVKASWKPDKYLAFFLAENEKFKADLRTAYERTTPFEEFTDYASERVARYINFVSLPPVIVTERARGKIKKLFEDAPESVQAHLHYIEQGLPHNVTIEMSLLLSDLSQFPEVRQTATAQEFVQKLKASQVSPEFMEKWREFMENFGFRCPKEIDVATPRYYERPEDIFALLKTMGIEDDPDRTPRGHFENAAKQRIESVQHLEAYLAKNSRRKVKAFRKHYQVLKTFAPYRETPKYYMVMAIDYIRRRALALARQWVEAGRLDCVDQIFDLRLAEIARAETDPRLDLRVLARANHAYYAQFNPQHDPPVLIDSRGKIPSLPPRPGQANELVGTPVSPGVVIGPVKVLKYVDEKPILPGEILVTKATDPGWTTLFLNAGGVLLENGGTLQHGASVARELGKPCIVGIDRITEILQDGQIVEMDGAAGVVRILG